jgi:hypothetical protein
MGPVGQGVEEASSKQQLVLPVSIIKTAAVTAAAAAAATDCRALLCTTWASLVLLPALSWV